MSRSTIHVGKGTVRESSLTNVRLKNLMSLVEDLPFDTRLIDTDIFYLKGSGIGNIERYNRGKTLHTINVWWARRPLSTMRVLLFASLINEQNEQTIQLFDDLSNKVILSDFEYEKTQKLLRKENNNLKILDPFGGNGTIAFEASNLGLEAYSMDINEYAYFIQHSLLELGFNYSEAETRDLLKKHGSNILTKLSSKTENLFPLRSQKITNYLWSYSMICKTCHSKYSISKRKYLSKKGEKNKQKKIIGLKFDYTEKEEHYSIIENSTKETMKSNNWQGKTTICPYCKSANSVIFPELKDQLLVGVRLKDLTGKDFIKIQENGCPPIEIMENELQQYIREYNLHIPQTPIEKWSGIVNPGIYGMNTHGEIFNLRQQLVIVILITLLIDEYIVLTSERGPEIALFIITVLAGLLDQLIDWNCRISMWIPENEQVGRAFCGPGIPMLWDYSEIDPGLNGPANLWQKLERILSSKRSFVPGSIKPIITRGSAQLLPFHNDFFDLIITDPPYYDNIFYSVLSNFFYTWKKVLMEKIDPELFIKDVTTSDGELVSSTHRNLDSKSAHLQYISDFSKVIGEIERVCKKNGLFGLIYGHSAIEGWIPILEAYRKSHFFITSVQPLRIERIQRPRSIKSNASNSVVVIIARKSFQNKKQISITDILIKIKQICNSYIPSLQKDNWSTFEIGIPIFANCIGLLANYSHIFDETNEIIKLEVLIEIIIKSIQEYLPDFTIKSRKSL